MFQYIIILIIIIIIIIYKNNTNNYNNFKNILEQNGIIVSLQPKNIINKPFIHIKDKTAINDIMSSGSLGFGESYMSSKWSTPNLLLLIKQLLKIEPKIIKHITFNPNLIINILLAKIINRNSLGKNANLVALQHYDLSNNLYENMLDPYMQYSCAYWKPETKNLKEAQLNKLNLIACKLKLKPGLTVLDIGCGWGGLSYFLASKYNVKVIAISLSKEQINYANKKFKHPNIEYKIQDYRELNDNDIFDRIVSVGMFEHVGYKNYDTFFKKCNHHLKDNGYCLVHTIGCRSIKDNTIGDPWLDKYIFPGGMLPTIKQATDNFINYFYLEDFQNFGLSYTKTLNAWYNNFHNALDNNKLEKKFTTTKFINMWDYYLKICQAGFEVRQMQLWHFLFVKRDTTINESSIYARNC